MQRRVNASAQVRERERDSEPADPLFAYCGMTKMPYILALYHMPSDNSGGRPRQLTLSHRPSCSFYSSQIWLSMIEAMFARLTLHLTLLICALAVVVRLSYICTNVGLDPIVPCQWSSSVALNMSPGPVDFRRICWNRQQMKRFHWSVL